MYERQKTNNVIDVRNCRYFAPIRRHFDIRLYDFDKNINSMRYLVVNMVNVKPTAIMIYEIR